MEYLLDPANKDRVSLLPIQHEDIWQKYKHHQASFWVAEEVDLSQDEKDWKRLNENEKRYIKNVLAFFSSSDFIVNENEGKKSEEVTVMEYQFFLRDKAAREDVHSFSYALMIEAYVKDEKEKTRLKSAVVNDTTIKKKADWFRKYINDGNFVTRELAGAITEGIFFCGSFCAIFWLKKRNLMPGLCAYNEFISRDECMHYEFACMIYRDYIVNKLPKEEVIEMIKSAVDIEIEFCCESLPVALIGINSDSMGQYIQYVADGLSSSLIGEKIYNVSNPFEWMALISVPVHTDFFAHRVNTYAKQKALPINKDKKGINIHCIY